MNLSSQQISVARLVAKGHSDREIAELLGVSINTVKSHLRIVFRKTGLCKRAEIMLRYAEGLDWALYPDNPVPPGVYVEICFQINTGFVSGWISWKSAVVLGDSRAQCIQTGAHVKPPFYWRLQKDIPLA